MANSPRCPFEGLKTFIDQEQYENAVKLASQLLKKDEDPVVIEAKLCYRLEDYAKSRAIYDDLLASSPKDPMLMTNAVAANVSHLGDEALPPNLDLSPNDKQLTYELAFNLGCQQLEHSNLPEAAQLFQRAEELCEKEIDAEYGRITDELRKSHGGWNCIQVQKACLLEYEGQDEAALEQYQLFLDNHGREADVTVEAVAQINSMALRGEEGGIGDRVNVANIASGGGLVGKMTEKQKRLLVLLRAGLLARAQQYQAALQLIQPHHLCYRPILLTALYCWMKLEKFGRCEKVLWRHIKGGDFPLEIILIKCLIFSRKFRSALDALRRTLLLHPHHASSVMQVMEDLLVLRGDAVAAIAYLSSVITEAKTMKVGGEEIALSLSLSAAKFAMDCKDWKKAEKFYEEVTRKDPQNRAANLGNARVLSALDPPQAYQFGLSLKPLLKRQKLALLDSEELAATEVAPPTKDRSIRETKLDQSKISHKKKKKKKYPKNFDPNAPATLPDPERWLPKHERSTYKRNGKKRGQLARGPQGATASTAPTGPTTKHAEVSVDTSIRQRTKGRKKR